MILSFEKNQYFHNGKVILEQRKTHYRTFRTMDGERESKVENGSKPIWKQENSRASSINLKSNNHQNEKKQNSKLLFWNFFSIHSDCQIERPRSTPFSEANLFFWARFFYFLDKINQRKHRNDVLSIGIGASKPI